MKKLKHKVKFILSLTLIIMLVLPTFSLGFSWDSIMGKANGFLAKGSQKQMIDDGTISSVVNPILGMLTAIAVIILVGVTIVMGINYVTAGPDKAAQLKQQSIGLLISAIIVFGALGITRLFYSIFS